MEFRILGPLEVVVGREPVALGGPQQLAVLARLLWQRNEAVPRDRLVAAVWHDDPPRTAVTSLQVHVHALRRALGAERIVTSGSSYRLRVEEGELDLDRFEELVERARNSLADDRYGAATRELDGALALWRGPVLAGAELEGELALAARELDERRLEAIELRNDALLGEGRHDRVLADVDRLIEEEPYRERLRAHKILALYRAGRQADSLDAYRAARATWRDELGLEPTPALRELERAVLRQDASLDAAKRPATERRRPLPAAVTNLVGRRLEIAAVAALLRDETRLVTLVGPGGTGKTRIALAVAEELAAELDDGAVFADLSALLEPELLPAGIADALGASEAADGGIEGIVTRLRDRRLLLVLDNFEQLLAAAPQVSELLAGAPALRVLVTSRAALRLRGEQEYAVPPLPLPSPALDNPTEVSHNEAVTLFAMRARAVVPSFSLDGDAALQVAAICRRLDGLPLAIELAAARTKVLGPAELLRRLDEDQDLLGSGPRDLPARQSTLTATIRWSIDLLDDDEQRAFARLAVFSGGFSADAAHRVCDVDLDTLETLVDNSLVRRRDAPAATRFSMLETVRAFAEMRLAEAGEGDAVRRRQAEWLAELAEGAEAKLKTSEDAATWLDVLELEHDNLRAALGWALEGGAVELALRVAAPASHFWEVRGHLMEGRRWLDGILDVGEAVPAELGLRAEEAAGRLAFHSGDFDAAERHYSSALALARDLGDDVAVARALSDLGAVAAALGDLDRATTFLEESAEAFRKLGERRRLALTLANIGHVTGERHDFARAIVVTEEALAIQRELGDRQREAVSLVNLGSFLVEEGELGEARSRVAECLSLAFELGYKEVIAYGLVALLRICAAEGDDSAAATIAGATDALLTETGIALVGRAAAMFSETKAAVRSAVGDDGYLAACEAGRRRPLAELVAYVRC